ncbi:phosphate transport system ATP-binding protein [Symbiobacterium terraclitae]|uniref:Phosphate transport system ATP-binding protein n=1 Tax=Symbiobacterium terraclitae TaxID=557451 RepID=A0ABS4JX07_9FIRM|nr:phosphate ABC transporter ATP-binding protein PstB [Symbiobacterium terraclitae]MBP2020065.1 phosphate transport system ATP-binding protein [Symbiobacterium terraclitae]
MSSSRPKMETRGLRVFYGEREALRGVTLAVPDRSVTALIGPSGCGKSTFLRCLNRMHDLNPGVRVEGRILLDGRPVDRLDPQILRCRVGMLFQRPNPFPMSIYRNVAFGPALFGVRGAELDRIVEEALRRAALWDEVKGRLHQHASGLSGGQQQRLCLARALAMEPEVLLMDEPCSALDPAATEAVEALIRELRRTMAIVIVTHSMDQARRIADRVAYFQDGRLVEEGPAAQVLTRPQCEETRRFLTHSPTWLG